LRRMVQSLIILLQIFIVGLKRLSARLMCGMLVVMMRLVVVRPSRMVAPRSRLAEY